MSSLQQSVRDEVPGGDYYVILECPFGAQERLASRDLYASEQEAFDTAKAMADQDCGEPGSPSYCVMRLEEVSA